MNIKIQRWWIPWGSASLMLLDFAFLSCRFFRYYTVLWIPETCTFFWVGFLPWQESWLSFPSFFLKTGKDVSFHPFKGQIYFRRRERNKTKKKHKERKMNQTHDLWDFETPFVDVRKWQHGIAACSPKKVLHFSIWVRRSLGSFLTKHLIQSCTKINYTGGTSKWQEKSVTCNCYQCWRKQVI